VPRLFTGRLPDINIGTDDGRSCDLELIIPLLEILAAQSQFSFVVNGRFKGGHITRHFGSPADGVHALQIELAQACYMDEDRASYDEARAAPLRELLQRLVAAMLRFSPAPLSR
jgi:N-formylglutamate deformylase